VNRAVTTLVGLVVKRGPDAVKWASVVTPFVTDTGNRERFARLSERLSQAHRARTPQGRLEGEVRALREAATQAVQDAGDPAEEQRAQGWLRRANRFDSSLRLIVSAQPATRRRGLVQLSAQVDRLRDEVLLATLGVAEETSGGDA
jgi:hypothetical protein